MPLRRIKPRARLGRMEEFVADKAQHHHSAGGKALAEYAPKFSQLTDDVLLGDVWERPDLSKRDRSLITCAVIVASGKTEQMDTHFPRALRNGLTEAELIEMITHLAFYSGWPAAVTALLRARAIFGKTATP
jgi:4-carboxymuconolactone decarboxylase